MLKNSHLLEKVFKLRLSNVFSNTVYWKLYIEIFQGTVDDNGIIQSLNSTYNVDEGASNNESSAMFLADSIGSLGLYDSSTFDITINSVRTDTPTTTWVRAPGKTKVLRTFKYFSNTPIPHDLIIRVFQNGWINKCGFFVFENILQLT